MKWGGVAPKILDPILLAENKSQIAKNCRFDQGGIIPLPNDLYDVTPTKAGDKKTIFQYYLRYPADAEQITSWEQWTFDVFTSSGSNVTRATCSALASAASNHISFTVGAQYVITYNLTLYSGVAPSITMEWMVGFGNATICEGSNTFSLSAGTHSTSVFTAETDSAWLSLNCSSASDFACTFSIALAVPQVSALEKDFLTWLTDVDVAQPPIPDEVFNRLFYTENGVLKITDQFLFTSLYGRFIDPYTATTDYPGQSIISSPLAPVSAPVAACTPVGDDPTLLETRGYVYTYVNGYGMEGPPSPVSNLIDVYDGNTVSLTGLVFPAMADVNAYWIVSKRIYRLNQNATGSTQYQFVDEVVWWQTTYSDVILDSGLAEILATAEWDGPPAGIAGLIALPNQCLAAFVNNIVCFSVPKYPHAWPASYQKATDRPIVGLGAFGTTVVVITKGEPYLIIGNDPSNYVMEKAEGLSGKSKRGIVTLPQNAGVVYPSPDGLIIVGPTQAQKPLLTGDLFTPQQWNALYNPSTISGYYWEGKYIGFYVSADGLKKAGFMFDLKTLDWVDLDFYADAGFYDHTDGNLCLLFGNDIFIFCGAS